MVRGPRAYGAGVERALYRLARGTCYYPDCAHRIMTVVDDVPIVGVDIAHIRGAQPRSARYDPTMTDEQRAAFLNLILLCGAHHKLVDRIRPGDYPVEMLEAWKRDNEPEEGVRALASSGLTDEMLEAVMERIVSARGLRREVDVDLEPGLVMSPTDIGAMGDLVGMRTILEANEHLKRNPRVVVANIRNTGTLPVSVEGVDLWAILGDQPGSAAFTLMGRNDFGATNPQLPYRLPDGEAVRWLTKLETISGIVRAARATGVTVTGVRARVRLGTGEAIESRLMTWVDLE